MKKDILYEVYRVQELIGVQKNIIKENRYISFLSDIITDFIVNSKRTIPNVVDKVMIGAIEVEKKLYDDILEILKDPRFYGTLNDVEKATLGRVVAQSPNVVNNIYKKILTEMFNAADNLTEKTVISKIAQEYDKGNKELSQIIQEIIGTDDPFISSLLVKKIDSKIEDLALNKFVEEVKPKLKLNADDKIRTVIRNVAKDPDTIDLTTYKDINWINRFLSSNVTVLNLVRRSANSGLLRLEKKLLGNEEFIKRTVKDIIQTIDTINVELQGDMSKVDTWKMLTKLRSTASKIKVIQNTYKTDIDALYAEIEKSLNDNVTDVAIREKIPEFMTKLKEVDPFASGSWEQKSYALKFLNNTSTQQTLNNIGRILKYTFTWKKQVWSEIEQLLSRIPSFLLFGSPKTLGDLQSYFVRYGDVGGWTMLARDLWIATHIGLPVTMATVHMVYNFFLLNLTTEGGVPRGDIKNDFITNLKNDFANQYKGMRFAYEEDEMNLATITYGLLSPGHFIGMDVFNWIKEITGAVERGEKRPKTEIPQQVRELFEKYQISKSTQDSMVNAIVTAATPEEAKKMVEQALAPIVDKLADGEAGFRAFCDMTKDAEFRKKHGIDKEYTFKEWRGLSGLTNEINPLVRSNNWSWDAKSNIFKPYN